MGYIVYDIETFSNFLLISFYDVDSKKFEDFIYRGDNEDIENIRIYLREANKQTIVHFNGMSFDNPVLECFFQTKSVAKAKEKANDIIQNRRYSPVRLFEKEIDLMLLMTSTSFDRYSGLKEYAVRLERDSIIEFSGDFALPLPKDQEEECIRYCHEDLLVAAHLLEEDLIHKRWRERNHFAKHFASREINQSQRRLVEEAICKQLKEAKPQEKELKAQGVGTVFGGQQMFQTEKYQKLYESLETAITQVSTATDKVFLKEEVPFPNFTAQVRLGKIYGHMPKMFMASDQEKCWQVQIYGLEDSAVQKYRIFPREHYLQLGELYNKWQKASSAPENYALHSKLIQALPFLYGDSRSPLHDETCSLLTGIHAQIALLTLLEKIENCSQIFLLNNGNLILTTLPEQQTEFEKCLREWEKKHNVSAKLSAIQGFIIRSTYDYAIIKDNKIDYAKGSGFQVTASLFRNHSTPLIVGKAIENRFLHNIPFSQTVKEAFDSKDVRQFVMVRKVKEDGRNHVFRYFYSHTNQTEHSKLESNTTLCPVLSNVDWNNLDQSFYKKKAQEIWEECAQEKPGLWQWIKGLFSG